MPPPLRPLALAVSVALLGAACGDGATTVADPPSTTVDLVATLGPCSDPGGDRGDLDSTLATPGSWYRVTDPEATIAEDSADASLIVADATYVGGDADLAAEGREAAGDEVTFRASATTAELVAAAGDVVDDLSIRAEPGPGSTLDLNYVIGFADDVFAFVGDCAATWYTIPLTERLGADAFAVVRSLVGADGPTIAAAIEVEEEPAPSTTLPPGDPGITDPEAPFGPPATGG